MNGAKDLYFTSSLSGSLNADNNGTAHEGLYKCSFDAAVGTCEDPKLVVDQFYHDREDRRGLRLGHISIVASSYPPYSIRSSSNNKKNNNDDDHDDDDDDEHPGAVVYATYFEDNSRGFEIVRGPLTRGSKVRFRSFFRSNGVYSSRTCNRGCCPGARHAYLVAKPASYIVDAGDAFVSWAGFHRNCASDVDSDFKWTIGISRVQDRPGCTMTDEKADFAECTTPVALTYTNGEEDIREDVFLSFSSFQTSRMPSGQRLFFLSVIRGNSDNPKIDPVVNEIWAVLEQASGPGSYQVVVDIRIDDSFVYHSAQNLGSMRLHLDDNGLATAICITAYDGGIFCEALWIDVTTGKVTATTSSDALVTSEQIKKKCAIKPLEHYPLSGNIPAVASGLDVVWNDDGSPECLVFGCLGEVPGQGGFFALCPDRPIVQALDGAYPGSILFSPNPSARSTLFVARDESGSSEGPVSTFDEIEGIEVLGTIEGTRSTFLIGVVVVSFLLVLAASISKRSRTRMAGVLRSGSWSLFQRTNDDFGPYQHESSASRPVYVELPSSTAPVS